MSSLRKVSSIIFIIITIILSSTLLTNANVLGETQNMRNSQPYNRILFVIDCSNSMNYHDQSKLVNEIVKMFLDGAYSENTDIGFVTYNDNILNTYPLTPISEATNREVIKAEIDKIVRFGSTDIGMAINYGMDMFINDPRENSKPIIILFSDGETDLTYTKTGRTYNDSLEEENAAFEKSKKINCPIYSVGLSKDASLNTTYLSKIAENTGGKRYEIQNSGELLESFKTIFSEIMGVSVNTKEVVKGTGVEQTISVNIPSDYINEANILLQHKSTLRSIKVEHDLSNINVFESKNYASIKILNPSSNNVKISFIADRNNEVKVNVVNFIDVLPVVKMPKNLSLAEIEVEAKLQNINTGKELLEPYLYEGLKAELFVTDIDTGEHEIFPMKNTGTGFVVKYSNDKPKSCNVQVNVVGKEYNVQSPILVMPFSNTSPEKTGSLVEILLKQSKDREYNLNDYYKDADGDLLSYEIINQEKDGTTAVLQDSRLIISSANEGLSTVTVSVSDNRGGVIVETFKFNILPSWIYYRSPIIVIGCIFIVLLVAYLIFTKKTKKVTQHSIMFSPNIRFNGARFEGYFLNTLSGIDIPVLNWNASYINNLKSISLGDLFALMDVSEKLPEAYKIYFEAGNNGTVIFYHNTNCIISFGKQTIPEGKKQVLNYDDKLYIVFENHVTEIELRYKRIRKMAIA